MLMLDHFFILIKHRQIEMISDGNEIIEVNVLKMKILNFKDFMEKYNLENASMNGSELERVYNYLKYPRDSKIYSDNGFVNIDNGSLGGTHWRCFL